MSFESGNFLEGLIGMVINLLWVYMWIVIVRVLISWINPDPDNQIIRILHSLTEPALSGLRRRLPKIMWSTGLDFTPLVLILLLQFIMWFLENIKF